MLRRSLQEIGVDAAATGPRWPRRRRRRSTVAVALVLTAILGAGRVDAAGIAGTCFCDEQSGISISQLVRAVNIALGMVACPLPPSQPGDSLAGLCFCNDSGSISISQLVRAVNIALGTQPCPVGAFVGPAGGTLSTDDPRSPLAGIKLNVPAGAVSGANITLTARTDSDLPLPPGLVGLGYGFELASDEAPSSDLELCFPVLSGQRRSDHMLSGLVLNTTDGRWEVTLPDTVGDDVFTVRTRQLGVWRPGVTLVREVDSDLLFGSIVSIHGPDVIAQFQAGARNAVQPFIDQIGNIGTWSSCSAVAALTDALRSARTQARMIDLSNIAPQCGACEVSSGDFSDDVVELVRIKVSSQVTDQTIALLDLDFAADAAAQLLAFGYYENKISELSCDYDCFLEANPNQFWLNVGTFYAAELAVAAAEYVATQIPCG